MVIWKVREVAQAKGIRSASELAERAKLNKNTATVLWNGQSLRADRETLTKLCEALDCKPGDLLAYEDIESGVLVPA